MVGINNEKKRYEWIERTLLSIPEGNKILDAGAGELKFRKYCEHLNYTSQDFGEYEGEGDGKGLQKGEWDTSKMDIVSDITNIPVKDDSFDAVMCVEVIEHVPDPLPAIRELKRVLKTGGKLILTAPFNSLTHFAPYHFSTGFSRYYYEYHMKELGFEILDLNINGNYFEYLAQELHRLPKISRKYSSTTPGLLTRQAIKSVLRFLGKASARDQGSSDLLYFGIQLLARKL